MKIIFLGTPEFAVPVLQKLIDSKHDVVAVVTNLDKPVGRSDKLMPSPVKKVAIENNIPVYQYKKIRLEGVEDLKNIGADIMVTCAFGQILSRENLDVTPMGTFNVHGSLLPKYRGASPIQWSIINGEDETGITILKSDVGIDDGQVIHQVKTKIKENETAEELFDRLSYIGADAIIEALEMLENNTAEFVTQNEEDATLCKMFKKETGNLDFNNSAKDVKNLINGLNMWPVAYTSINGDYFKFYKASLVSDEDIQRFSFDLNNYQNGEVVYSKSKFGLVIKCNDGFVKIDEIQIQNGKRMETKNFLNGKQIAVGSICERVEVDE